MKSARGKIMEIIISDISYDNISIDINQYIDELRSRAKEFAEDVQVEKTEIGYGADWPVYLLIIYGIFLQGKRISENLDSWISIARKFCSFIEYIEDKFKAYRLDEEAATLVAINTIVKDMQGNINSIEKLSEEIIPVAPLEHRSPDHLDHRPYAMYLQTYKVNNQYVYIFGIKSKGTIEIELKIDTTDWIEY